MEHRRWRVEFVAMLYDKVQAHVSSANAKIYRRHFSSTTWKVILLFTAGQLNVSHATLSFLAQSQTFCHLKEYIDIIINTPKQLLAWTLRKDRNVSQAVHALGDTIRHRARPLNAIRPIAVGSMENAVLTQGDRLARSFDIDLPGLMMLGIRNDALLQRIARLPR